MTGHFYIQPAERWNVVMIYQVRPFSQTIVIYYFIYVKKVNPNKMFIIQNNPNLHKFREKYFSTVEWRSTHIHRKCSIVTPLYITATYTLRHFHPIKKIQYLQGPHPIKKKLRDRIQKKFKLRDRILIFSLITILYANKNSFKMYQWWNLEFAYLMC